MGLGKKLKDFIAPVETEEELELSEEESESLSQYEKPQVEGASKIAANTNIVLFEPRDFNEAEEIGRHIKLRRACAINLHRMPADYRQRIIVFLSGVIFGVDGSIRKIGENVILCAPKSMPVGGEITFGDGETDGE